MEHFEDVSSLLDAVTPEIQVGEDGGELIWLIFDA